MTFENFDLPLQKFVTSLVGRSDLFDRLVFALAKYDLFKGVVLMAMTWFAWFWKADRQTAKQEDEKRARIILMLAGSVVAVVLSRGLQLMLQVHSRPILASTDIRFPAFIDPAALNTWNSFPSDHAVIFFALATGLWRINRWFGVFGYVWSTVIVLLPRVYLGLHYPSDVLAGAMLGVVFMLGWERLPLNAVAHRVLKWGKLHPALFYCMAFLVTEQMAYLFDDIRGIAHTLAGHSMDWRP